MAGPRVRAPWRLVVVGMAVSIAAPLLAACGQAQIDVKDDLCVQYGHLVDKAESLQDIDPNTAGVDEIRDRVHEVQDQLDALQAVAEGQLDTLISTLRAAVDDLAAAASDASEQALETARPLIEDTVDDVQQAWATLQQVGDARCGEAT